MIPNNLLTEYDGNSFNIKFIENSYWFFDQKHFRQPLKNNEDYLNICSRIHDLTYDSILIGGLGLGYMPYWISNNTDCSTIDVIDNNSELVYWVQNNNHLDSSINLIVGDVFNYTTTNTYDLILLDIWWGKDFENIPENEPILLNRFKGNVNQNGSIYICLNNTLWTKN